MPCESIAMWLRPVLGQHLLQLGRLAWKHKNVNATYLLFIFEGIKRAYHLSPLEKINSKLFAHKIIIPWEKIATSPIHKASRNIRVAVIPSGESHHVPTPFWSCTSIYTIKARKASLKLIKMMKNCDFKWTLAPYKLCTSTFPDEAAFNFFK